MWQAVKRRCSSRWTIYVLISLVVTYAVSIWLGFYISDELTNQKESVWVGFYASWVQDVIFFSIVGVAVFLHSIPYSADNATFDERIIAFYGNNTPKSLRDYAKSEFVRYGGYTVKAKRRIVIFEYDDVRDAFRIEYETTQEIKNLFDIQYEDSPVNQIIPAKGFDDPPEPFGVVSYINLGGKNVIPEGTNRNIPSDGSAWKLKVPLSISPNGSTTFENRYWVWVKAAEQHNYTPNRVVAEFDLTIQNTISDKKVIVKTEKNDLLLGPGDILSLETEVDVTPHNEIFRFSLECELVEV